ncbi:MAG: methylthioribose-1-phosphate isomerase [Flavobacteriales bacterium]|jgi:methylthioribose-1-phosphate isomerase
MIIKGEHKQTIWIDQKNPGSVYTFDQRYFPHETRIVELQSTDDVAEAIKSMVVRGAPLIGVTAAYGMYLAALAYEGATLYDEMIEAADFLNKTRPTAVNLHWAIQEQLKVVEGNKQLNHVDLASLLLENAEKLKKEDITTCSAIGDYGLSLIREISQFKGGKEVNILTHCNAGWLACIDWGTATSPIYKAYDAGIRIHVWVDETRPRLQGANLTAFELAEHGVPHTVITDNAGGHLMQHGEVDMVIVGTDRVTRTGDVANKIGTYLKALAANDNHIPFYVALPSTTIDWTISNGLTEIPIETRSPNEIHKVMGKTKEGKLVKVRITPENSSAINHGFDVTPSRLVSALITERGICEATENGLLSLFPEFMTHELH